MTTNLLQRRRDRKVSRRRKTAWRPALVLLLPALIGLLLFHLWPLFEMIRLSLVDFKIFTGESSWVGLDNYSNLFADPVFRESMFVTFLFFVIKVPVQVVLALGLALFVVKPGPGVTLARTVILLPTVTALVVVTTLWGMLLNGDQGLVNGFLDMMGLPGQSALTSTTWALPTVALITVWRGVGLSALFFIAGLLTIPRELYEAASVDGATRNQLFRHVTLPLLRPTMLFVLITASITAFKVFVPIQVLTSGGPSGNTRVIIFYMIESAFKFGRFSFAATISVVVMLLLLVISLIQLRFTQRKEAL